MTSLIFPASNAPSERCLFLYSDRDSLILCPPIASIIISSLTCPGASAWRCAGLSRAGNAKHIRMSGPSMKLQDIRLPAGPAGRMGKSSLSCSRTMSKARKGLAKCRQLMQLERELGFRSSFNFIPEGDYAVSRELREELAKMDSKWACMIFIMMASSTRRGRIFPKMPNGSTTI